jgi:hypothetical protein
MPARTQPHRLLMACCWFLVVFLVLFPKGGIKLGPLPITWGYLFLGLSTPIFLLVRLLARPLRFSLLQLAAVAMLVPIQVLMLYTFLAIGVWDPAYAFSNFVSLTVLPWIFLLVYPPFLRFVDGVRLSSYLRHCILIAALWGIFLFVYYPLTGHFIEIPFITVNIADYGKIESTKHISRGLFSKLISTYNNGNVYGVATLILLPLYDLLEPSRWRRRTVKLALLLSLSRTVWFGLLINEMLPVVVLLWRQIRTFPVVYLARFKGRLIAVGLTFLLILFALLLLSGPGLRFLFDPTAGGRLNEITALNHLTVFPSRGLGGWSEVVYASALQDLGWSGLFSFVLVMGSPILLLLIDRRPLKSPIRRAALKGLILYAFLALSDGAFAFIPVMAFYWFAYMIYLFGWPAARPLAVAAHPAGVFPATALLASSAAAGGAGS